MGILLIDLEESCVEILLSIVGVAFLIGLLFRSVAGVFFTAIALIAYIPMKYENDCRKLKLEVSHSMPGIYRTLGCFGIRSDASQAIEYVGNHSLEQLPSILFERLLNCVVVCLLSLL